MKVKKLPFISLLSEQFPEYSEKELYSMIVCGEAKADGETIRRPRQPVAVGRKLSLANRRWVSRGGEKLEHALNEWKIVAHAKTVLDAGASTGGFTDCLLHHGAACVHSVDVGYNQLDYRLRTDDRVNVLERTNIMSVERLAPPPHFAVADLSFRSIRGAAGHILRLTTENLLLALIKPQFEIEPDDGFDGVIRENIVVEKAVKETAAGLGREGVLVQAVTASPVRGTKGNREFFFKLKLDSSASAERNQTTAADYFQYDN